jgi:hypothetical protein
MKDTMELPVKLTKGEKLRCGELAASLAHQAHVLEEQRKLQNAELKSQIDALNDQIGELFDQLRTGEQVREVEVEREKDYEHGVERITRLDIDEVISERTLGPEEMQQDLPGTNYDGPPEGASEEEKLVYLKGRVRRKQKELRGESKQ